jgi:hypothetical protein
MKSSDVTIVLSKLKEQSKTMKNGYGQILSMTQKLSDVMAEYCK